MKALVTGANGFIGTFLVEELLKDDHEVRCLVLQGESVKSLDESSVQIFFGDVTRIDTLQAPLDGVDYIFHLAAVKNAWEEVTYRQVNLVGTKNVLDVAERVAPELKRLIFVSTLAAAGPSSDGRAITEDDVCRPLGSYGKTKLEAEQYLMSHRDRVPITIVRLTAAYGPRNEGVSLMGWLLTMAERGWVFQVGKNGQMASPVHVLDVVRGLILAAQHPSSAGQIYFLAGPENLTLREITSLCFDIWDKKGRIFPVPRTLAKTALDVAKLYRRVIGRPVLLLNDIGRQMLEKFWICSSEKIRSELGFEPKITLRQGLKSVIDWYERTPGVPLLPPGTPPQANA